MMNSNEQKEDNYLSEIVGYSALADEEEELLLEEEGAEKTDPSDVSRNALIRSLVIFVGVGMFSGALLLILSLFQNTSQQTANKNQAASPQEEKIQEQSNEELQQLKDENSRLRAERALAKQKQQETRTETSQPETPPSESPDPKDLEPVPEAESNLKPAPQPIPVQPPPQPKAVRVQSPSKPEPEPDPEKRWNLLAQAGQLQGSGYSGSPMEIDEFGGNAALASSNKNVMPSQEEKMKQVTESTVTHTSQASEGKIERYRLNLKPSQLDPQDSSGMSEGERGIIQFQGGTSESVLVSQMETSGEQRIIRRSTPQYNNTSPSAVQLPIGSNAAGVVEVPMVWSPSTETPTEGRFVVRLSEPLRDMNGEIAIDAGAMLVTDVIAKGKANHLIRQSVVAIVYEYQGEMRQLEIPEGLLLVRAQGNLPLIAQGMNDPDDEMAKQDTLIGLLSAVGRVGEVLNDPSEEIVIDDGDDLRVEQRTRHQPDLVGAVLEGFFNPLADRLESRSQQEVQELLERPNIYVVEVGTPVSVFVNGLITVEK